MSYIYLASPYTHPDTAVKQARYERVCNVVAAMLRDGNMVFSPVAYMHPIAEKCGLPHLSDFYRDFNLVMLDRAKELWLFKDEGWEVSIGMQDEKGFAQARGMRIQELLPDQAARYTG